LAGDVERAKRFCPVHPRRIPIGAQPGFGSR
jgi:hypothetical protein